MRQRNYPIYDDKLESDAVTIKPDKGHKDGSCNRLDCQAPRATWRHRDSGLYYCIGCACRINDLNYYESLRMHGGRLIVPPFRENREQLTTNQLAILQDLYQGKATQREGNTTHIIEDFVHLCDLDYIEKRSEAVWIVEQIVGANPDQFYALTEDGTNRVLLNLDKA